MKSPEELLSDLSQFIGTTNWYKHPLFPKYRYTDGVQYLAKNAECYWLLEYIFSNQLMKKIAATQFQVWKLEKNGAKATITVEDGDDNVVHTFSLSFTTFPLDEFKLWFIDNTLLLLTEY